MQLDITTADGYNIACALRGPDSSNTVLKWVFTARIRALAGLALSGSHGLVRIDTLPVPYATDLRGLLPSLINRHYHFLNHARSAALALATPDLARLVIAVQSRSIAAMDVETIIEWAGSQLK